MINFFIGFLLTIFVIVACLLILVILMQRSKQDGLGAAFGGGLTETVFGAQTSTILVRFTAWLIGIFFISAIALAWLYGHRGHHRTALSERLHAAAPAQTAPATPTTPAPAPSPAPIPVRPHPAPAQ